MVNEYQKLSCLETEMELVTWCCLYPSLCSVVILTSVTMNVVIFVHHSVHLVSVGG